jgi:hypothetical protein
MRHSPWAIVVWNLSSLIGEDSMAIHTYPGKKNRGAAPAPTLAGSGKRHDQAQL